MKGAECVAATLRDAGVDVCFANPGTSEMHFVAALDTPGLRSILCLFEGVATGAADGYYRMKDNPASTLLHLGPGLANGLANLHNAKRANSGIVNIIGEHSALHLQYDSPLTSDIEGLARPLCHWVRKCDGVDAVGWDVAAAINQARSRPGQISALIVGGDVSWSQGATVGSCGQAPRYRKADPSRVEHVARVLKSGEPAILVLAGRALRADVLELAGKVAAKTGCRVASQFFSSRIERGAGRVTAERIPYAVDPALAMLRGFKNLITVGTTEPVAFFSYPNKPSLLKPADCALHPLTEPDEDSLEAMDMLVQAVGAAGLDPVRQRRSEQEVPKGPLNPQSIALVLSAAIPENAIVVDESLTTGRETFALTAGAAPHDAIQNMGGSIGYGTPVATGVAVACPDRKVICLVGDGSAMYTIQSLWTQVRESLDVTTVIFANHSYQILKAEFSNMGAGEPGPAALAMMEIDRPRIDWLAMAKSMGVPAVRVDSSEGFYKALSDSVREAGPRLIEVALR